MGIVDTFRTSLTRTVFQPAYWAIKNLPVLKYYRTFRSNQWSSREAFENRQKKALAELMQHAIQNVPYYNRIFSGNISRDVQNDPFGVLRSWPILERHDVNTRQEELFIEMGRGTFRNSTGGSTGTPTFFLQDHVYQAATLGATMLLFEWCGRPPGTPLIKLWGAHRDIPENGSRGMQFSLSNFLQNRVVLNCHVVTPRNIETFVRTINGYRPCVVEAYADVLYEIATRMEEINLHIRHNPKGIVTSATTLLPQMREVIEVTFRAPVFDRYGSREMGNMAAECPEHFGLHMMGETTILEVLAKDGTPAPNGEEGDILATNLWNYSMPFIRYRIGDTGIFSSKTCKCGRPYPLLEKITGRSNSVFHRKDGGIVKPTFFINFMTLLHNDREIHKFQVVQKNYDQFLVRLVPKNGGDFHIDHWDNRDALLLYIDELMGYPCGVRFSVQKDIEKTPTGKHLYVLSELNK